MDRMFEVKVAKSAGFCFGVQRAVMMAISALEDNSKPVYTLGPIIHNPQEVKRLQAKGIIMVDSLDEIESGIVIIRSHGAPKGIVDAAQKKGLKIVDATCPLVNRLKERVRDLAQWGYKVVIVGESDHPEVMAVRSYAPDSCMVTKGPEEILGGSLNKKVGIVAQTTQSLENLQSVASRCIEICGEVRTYNTICETTQKRGLEALNLAKEVDVMVVVGGKNSGNTKRLAEALRRRGTATFHIESSQEIPGLALKTGSRVGVTAGASTPAWIIDDVVETLEKMN
jgi:(E)-4-hydroxy-3-methyl-but-2-enyl pyrophosphate reductase